ncbi:MAG: sigma-E factor negative regulatory protein [Luminiphilus sp.]|nr:sigma-E factor negative regulatory protein [Luminiphilus sp.]
MTESNESKHATDTREAMSALLDGEATEFELARILKASEQSAEVRDYWIRQSRYRDSVRGFGRYGGIDVSKGVRAAISQEPKRTANPLISMAVAATVTIAVVLVGQQDSSAVGVPNESFSVPGVVVQLPGTGAVQASFGDSVTPLSGQNQYVIPELARSPVLESREIYERIAKERYQTLAPLQAATAADVALNPYIVRIPAVNSGSK